VHRYEDAARAYAEASRRVGDTPGVLLGRARAAARLALTAQACEYYRAFIALLAPDRPTADEIVEAQRFRLAPACSSEPRVTP
jgi:cytochrome c-type biogenesis protein CcmH/NrfG